MKRAKETLDNQVVHSRRWNASPKYTRARPFLDLQYVKQKWEWAKFTMLQSTHFMLACLFYGDVFFWLFMNIISYKRITVRCHFPLLGHVLPDSLIFWYSFMYQPVIMMNGGIVCSCCLSLPSMLHYKRLYWQPNCHKKHLVCCFISKHTHSL